MSLCTLFTNIELSLLYDIINEDFNILNIEEKFGISKINFIELIKILMQKFSYIYIVFGWAKRLHIKTIER